MNHAKHLFGMVHFMILFCCFFSAWLSVYAEEVFSVVLLNRIYGGKTAPMYDFGINTTAEYEVATKQLDEVIAKIKSHGIEDNLVFQLEAAENRIVALEIERMFRYAVAYGAKLQRELDDQSRASHK